MSARRLLLGHLRRVAPALAALVLGSCGDPGRELVSNLSDAGGVVLSDGGHRSDGALARLVFSVKDRDTGVPLPSRVIFRPPPGSGFADSVTSGAYDDNSPGSFTGQPVAPGVVGSPEGVLLASGLGEVPVPPGDYELFITRGPEYEAEVVKITVGAGDVRDVAVALERSVDTRGWLAADLHVHTLRSFDSKLPLDRRVISMTTSGIELMVTTDHDGAVDLAPTIAALGYSTEVAGSVVGDEFTFRGGHGGAYPIPYNAALPGGGAPGWIPYAECDKGGFGINCKLAADAFPYMHGLIPGTTVVTINHPWRMDDLGYFTNPYYGDLGALFGGAEWGAGTKAGFSKPLSSAGQFDALEVLNGYGLQTRSDCKSGCAPRYLLADWFYLLGQGHRVTALGSSDTHKINWVRAGWPRSWLRLPLDRPGEVTGALLADAIRHQRAIASTGPFATLTVDGAGIGDLVVPKQHGQVTVEATVDAPSWMTVDTVVLYVNGVARETWAVTPGARPVFHRTVVAAVTGDASFVLYAVGETPLPADVVGEYSVRNGYPMTPWVVTNPVLVDADGDGKWQPPPWRPEGGTPPPMWHGIATDPAAGAFPPNARTPQDCEPRGPHEAPLEAPRSPEQVLMPLLYP